MIEWVKTADMLPKPYQDMLGLWCCEIMSEKRFVACTFTSKSWICKNQEVQDPDYWAYITEPEE